ncbi:DUF1214 domain-containing protein [Methylovirgula sp. 4M-Z18]|uniref:DUF1214 domain-containing protein n=1 Tax=Methylovirgula sp. 4M-Z18 TaxID=2293567 RepID=UPI000E2FAF09|nr:DUF1214 domain-containing protein [Methylovirgula sp. 4M-Z18]RFB79569.1 DUF1214 domain-containing protein [Methylovirgula sp. 4M-Z18]
MSGLLRIFSSLIIAACLGLALTFFSIRQDYGFSALKSGPWTAWPKVGTDDVDPYATAALARSGELTLGSAEGLSFLARTDSHGALLSGHCTYHVVGALPAARYWTLTALTPSGQLVDNAAHRLNFTSQEILRQVNAPIEIAVAPAVQPGNWLPVQRNADFVLMLRLYDTAMSATTAAGPEIALPQIERQECAS